MIFIFSILMNFWKKDLKITPSKKNRYMYFSHQIINIIQFKCKFSSIFTNVFLIYFFYQSYSPICVIKKKAASPSLKDNDLVTGIWLCHWLWTYSCYVSHLDSHLSVLCWFFYLKMASNSFHLPQKSKYTLVLKGFNICPNVLI